MDEVSLHLLDEFELACSKLEVSTWKHEGQSLVRQVPKSVSTQRIRVLATHYRQPRRCFKTGRSLSCRVVQATATPATSGYSGACQNRLSLSTPMAFCSSSMSATPARGSAPSVGGPRSAT